MLVESTSLDRHERTLIFSNRRRCGKVNPTDLRESRFGVVIAWEEKQDEDMVCCLALM